MHCDLKILPKRLNGSGATGPRPTGNQDTTGGYEYLTAERSQFLLPVEITWQNYFSDWIPARKA